MWLLAHTLSTALLKSFSVCVWAMGYTCMLKFSRHPSVSVCAPTVLHMSTYTCIMTQKCATKRTNNYCLPVFAGSCYRVRMRVCVRNPIIPQRVLSAASWKSAAELRGCFSCVGEFARMYTCALNTSAPIQPSFLHLLLRAKKIPPELYESGQIIINPMTLKVWHTRAQASTTGRSITTGSKLVLMAVSLFESQLKSKSTPIHFLKTHFSSYWEQYLVSLRNMPCHRSKMSCECHFTWTLKVW